MNGLDLFSGIGGLTLALQDWVRPIAYCERDEYAQSVLLQRMRNGSLPRAPIWTDVTTLVPEMLPGSIDIIYGGFPCQDISTAGNGIGLEGKRSGLFFEIIRLCRDIRPRFIFLENVPAITVRGLDRVLLELTSLGYDSRWTIVSAAAVGAPHIRERWWLLAHANGFNGGDEWQELGRGNSKLDQRETKSQHDGVQESLANSDGIRGQSRRQPIIAPTKHSEPFMSGEHAKRKSWWSLEPSVGRVVDGLPLRVDRLRGLGNAVVPLAAKEAFMKLMGLT